MKAPANLPSSFDVRWIESGLEETEDSLADSALLFDAEPLFLPTEWNSASDVTSIARLRDATELFPPFSSRVGELATRQMALGEEDIGAFPLLSEDSRLFRLFMDEGSVLTEPLETTAVHVSIRSLGNSERMTEISETMALDLSQMPPTLWSPLEYVLILDPGFWLGDGIKTQFQRLYRVGQRFE